MKNKPRLLHHFHGVTIQFGIVILCILITLILGCSSSVNSVHDGLVGHVAYLASDDLAGRAATSRGDTLAREYIADRFKDYGLKPGMGDSYFQGFIYPGDIFHHKPDFSGKSVYNVIGIVPGQNGNQSIVIGAHYDHVGLKIEPGAVDSICNGADDNASGVAVMLELARAFSAEKPLPCNLVFVGFTAEESGLLGADHFANYPPEAIG
ncbi:MAG: M20/M25/M40 family metallo-hydrolase, partial [Candidatus Marinimicrobia bacterium]|nr:M20/M25/M40 family metallo-hydrolase [Candidatus Neomarinimicrobiota bacterium]